MGRISTEKIEKIEEIIEISPQLTEAGVEMPMSLTIYGWYVEQFINKTE